MVDLKAVHRRCVISRLTASQMVRESNAARERVDRAMERMQQRFDRSTRAVDRAATYLETALREQLGA
jgi:hypothetical protein